MRVAIGIPYVFLRTFDALFGIKLLIVNLARLADTTVESLEEFVIFMNAEILVLICWQFWETLYQLLISS